MFIVHVVPIARGIGKETLSYFTASEDIKLGSIVKVPVRSREITGLVVGFQPVADAKEQLKSSSFAMKKIGKLSMLPLFQTAFMDAAQDAAQYFVGSTGSVLASITPKAILEQADKIQAALPPQENKESHDPYVLQADEEERFAHYKSMIREQFARKKSLFLCMPTIQDTKRISEQITKGIEQYTIVLNSSVSKKELLTRWNKIISEEHPVLIIGTGAFLGVPRHDIGTYILERESASGYKLHARPYLDIRMFAEFLAKRTKAKLIFGDILLRIETLWRTKNNELTELAPLKFRSISTTQDVVVDMKKYKTLDAPEFRIISDELEKLIDHTKEHNEHLFIFAARRGLAPMTVCGDCGTTVTCTRCSAPIVLHRSTSVHDQDNEQFFLCHRCGERRSAEERCKNCNSWKLTTLGIGIELIEKTITSMYPDSHIFRLDKDTVTTHKQALAIAQDFYNTPGSMLLGTEMALAYLEKPIENSAVASIDSLFSIPDFRINEKIMSVLLKMRSLTQKYLVVQTRSREQQVFDIATKGNLMDFYREEIEARNMLQYPPFSMLIKISIKGTKEQVADDMHFIETYLKEYNPLIFPAFIETVHKKTVMHAVIKQPNTRALSKDLQEKLSALPPHVAVNVDPESLL